MRLFEVQRPFLFDRLVSDEQMSLPGSYGEPGLDPETQQDLQGLQIFPRCAMCWKGSTLFQRRE